MSERFKVHKFPPRPASESKYQYSHVINYGTYGIVLAVRPRDDPTGPLIALKVNYVDMGWSNTLVSWRESIVLSKINHPNIIGIRDFEITQHDDQLHDAPLHMIRTLPKNVNYDNTITDHVYYLMDMGGFNLQDIGKNLDLQESREIIMEIWEGLRYMHEELKLCHLDVKSNNVIKFQEGYKLCDFGFTMPLGNNQRCNFNIMHHIYKPPEILFKIDSQVKPELDIWCLGIIWYELLKGRVEPINSLFDHLDLYNDTNNNPPMELPDTLSAQYMYNILSFDHITENDLVYLQSCYDYPVEKLVDLRQWAMDNNLFKQYIISDNEELTAMMRINPSDRRVLSPISGILDSNNGLETNDDTEVIKLYISDLPEFKISDSSLSIVYAHHLYHYIGHHKEFYEYLRMHVQFEYKHLMMVTWYIAEKIMCVMNYPTDIRSITTDDEDIDIIRQLELYIAKYTNFDLHTHTICHLMKEFDSDNDMIRCIYMLYLLKPGVYDMNILASKFDHISSNRNTLLPTNILSRIVQDPNHKNKMIASEINRYIKSFRDSIKSSIISTS